MVIYFYITIIFLLLVMSNGPPIKRLPLKFIYTERAHESVTHMFARWRQSHAMFQIPTLIQLCNCM